MVVVPAEPLSEGVVPLSPVGVPAAVRVYEPAEAPLKVWTLVPEDPSALSGPPLGVAPAVRLVLGVPPRPV